ALFNGQDLMSWLLATDNYKTPVLGQKVAFDYPALKDSERSAASQRLNLRGGHPLVPLDNLTWQALNVDSTGVFSDRHLRSALLYTAYQSPKEQIVLLDAKGGTRTIINGMMHEGDHYDFGYTLIPVKLKKGVNEFIYTPGRFGRVESKIVVPTKPVSLTQRDMTLPDIILGEGDAKWAAIRLINATEKELRGLTITATLPTGESEIFATESLMPLSVRKVRFRVPVTTSTQSGEVVMKVTLRDRSAKVVDEQNIKIQQRPATIHHERTFVSRIDSSVQYYSVAPATGIGPKALVLSVHGASVEARNQARAYGLKDWTHIVAPTNRRPFGFNWEEWGRIDALEVLTEAKKVLNTIAERTYLTGHSMGGHGTWFLGTTYPDKFAAIAPCASYPDIIGYGGGRGDEQHRANEAYQMFSRAANGGRVLSLAHNLTQSGVYILHGDKDTTVPIEQVRAMRELLGTFHPNFCYYEYPGGEHWYGNNSVDWFPIFEFFARQSIPANKDVKTVEFHTASPAISAQDYWLRVEQQESPYNFTTISGLLNDSIVVVTPENVALFSIDLPSMGLPHGTPIKVGEQTFTVFTDSVAYFAFKNGTWSEVHGVNPKEKYSLRQGGFKQAFDNGVVLVYATGGTKEENLWWQNRARFDAETFLYRGNGSMDVIADTEYKADNYKDRNVVLYGNASNNSAWNTLLAFSPIQVRRGELSLGGELYRGDDLATLFVQPHPFSDVALVGVVSGSGISGMKATALNNYISGITGFPDFMVFSSDMLLKGLPEVKATGFFDNSWSLEHSEMVVNP
ncbi:MAG: prolyl oligopeptidase family serine peptidase, partial [Mucinivorans sp.]